MAGAATRIANRSVARLESLRNPGGGVANQLRTTCVIAWMLVLALVAGPASALGLGPIEVRSQRDQPLLAEIAVVSSDPAELDRLQARLASPETFARIGLQPPQGIVSDLKFALALDAGGRPVIRVTSAVPVQEPLLTFLIEVDWGQGRLVREYSALLDTPRSVAAPSQPPIQAPVLQPSNTIVRPVAPEIAASPAAVPQPAPDPVADSTPEPEPGAAPSSIPIPQAESAASPVPQADPDAITPTPAPAPPPGSARPVPVAGPEAQGDYGPVKAGDTLGAIAEGMRVDGDTLEQAMVALLRANPEAFIAGNINLVKQGAVLRSPADAERSRYSAAEAAAVVRMQTDEWRAMRRPVVQPDAVAGPPAAGPTASPIAATTAAAARPDPRATGARLEIVPPSQGSGQRAGTRSGIDAGGEGDMLRQELLQKDEALAARGAEVEELKARVADLERLQSQQQQLIQLKDSELAAAQQRLAANPPAAEPTTTTAPANQAPAGEAGIAGLLPWVGGALVLAGLLVWWVLRRGRKPRPATAVFDTAALAAAVPVRGDAPAEPVADPVVHPPERPAPAATPLPLRTPARMPAAARTAGAPTWHAVADAPAPAIAAGGPDRFELARAYVDLGDTETARGLLLELTASDDPHAREAAARMLRDLG